LLAPGELQQAFSDLKILVYREGWAQQASRHPKAVASLVARKPQILI
jgi:UDP-N-acetyl-D-mannosaminuronic acid transferase (WecB/TagA/CpsF family)